VVAVHKIGSRHYGLASHVNSPSSEPSRIFTVIDGVYGKIGTEGLAERAVDAL
jgi:hypothetical protein